MVLPLMLAIFFTALIVLTALAPRLLARRVDDFDQSQLDDTRRGIPRSLSPTFPVAAAAISAVVAGTSFALHGSAWPMWTLVVVVALVDVGVQRWSRPRVEQLLRDAGAMPPGDAALEHDEQQRRWSTAGTVTFTLGTCCQVLASFEPLSWLIFPGAVLILVAFVLVVVSGWKLLRGPDPEPIVLWHRDG
jgi:fatty acid desaturase